MCSVNGDVALFLDQTSGLESIVKVALDLLEPLQDLFWLVDSLVGKAFLNLGLARLFIF